jgi:putative aldouronate transport system permease protein
MSANVIQRKRKKRIPIGERTFNIVLCGLFLLFSVAVIYPFWDTLLLSFSDPVKASRLEFHLWNTEWSVASYEYLIEDGRILRAYLNTIIRTVATTVLMLVTTMLAAYPLSKRNLPGRTAITIFFLIVMFFSGGLIPSYMLIRNLGLMDKMLVLILPGSFSVYNMIIMRNYLMSLDSALEEAAFVEGAGYGTIMTRIIVPLSKPLLATVALWTAVANWNAWFDSLIYIQNPNLKVLQLLLREMVSDSQAAAASFSSFSNIRDAVISGPTVEAAMIMLTIGPIVLAYPFAQKHFVKGIMIGSLKG